MPDRTIRLAVLGLFILSVLVGGYLYLTGGGARLSIADVTGSRPTLAGPDRRFVPVVKVPKAVGWTGNATPVAATGLTVKAFAQGLDHPRWMLVLPNGDVLVAESNGPRSKASGGIRGWFERKFMQRAGAGGVSADHITLLRDTNGDGVADFRSVLVAGLNAPFGMALVGDQLYVADNDALLRFPFKPGENRIDAKPEKIVALPAGGHWTRSLVPNADGTRLYVGVGSASNIAEGGLEAETNRAAVLEVDIKSKDFRVYATGLRNPVGMAWEPENKDLWVVVNERDELGSDLVPDYLTLVEFGGNYGWPWYYWGGNVDPRVPEPDQDIRQYINRPDYALGPHVAALGLTFAAGAKLGPAFANGAFIGLHGSWNRRPLSGYKVIFVPFAKGRPKGMPVDVLRGFLNADEQARGRPVGVVIDSKGALLVADDVGNRIWRVTTK